MKILVVIATPSEMKAIKEGIKSADMKMRMDIDYLCCGVGNYETILSLENYLTQNPEPIFIRNIGICGYWNPNNEKESEPIQVASVINLHTEKEMIVPPFVQIALLRNCFSSENIILKKPEFRKGIGTINNKYYFDMESRGIEFVASSHKFPRLILKVPFDFIGCNKDVENKDYKKLAAKVDVMLKSLPYHKYLEKILGWINQQ